MKLNILKIVGHMLNTTGTFKQKVQYFSMAIVFVNFYQMSDVLQL